MSTRDHRYIDRLKRGWSRTLLCVLVLSGCGGGVDSGGTGARASTARGPVTGFGSVIVNGVHFDDSSAIISDIDGMVHNRDELKLGMTTTIRGSAFVVNSTGTRSTATSIVFGSAILGPVESVDTLARSLVVLGQPVDVTTTTVFDNSLSGGLASLSVNDVVEVYAMFNAANNHYNATRIERKASVSTYRLRGVVSNLDTATEAFNIGSQRISYSDLPANGVPAALANGRFVVAQLQIAPPGGVWRAIRLLDGVGPLDDQDEARLEGLIDELTSSTQFRVDGVSVDASQASLTGGALGLGIRVGVEGTARSGVLTATKVRVKTETDVENEGFELDGAISMLDTTHQTFVLQGITVEYAGSVEFLDGSMSDLAIGKNIEVEGTLSADRTGIQATRIRFSH